MKFENSIKEATNTPESVDKKHHVPDVTTRQVSDDAAKNSKAIKGKTRQGGTRKHHKRKGTIKQNVAESRKQSIVNNSSKKRRMKQKIDEGIVRHLNETGVEIKRNSFSYSIISQEKPIVPILEPTTGEDSKITQMHLPYNKNNIFDKPHQVKDDEKLRDFTIHVYKQSLRVFSAIKSKVNNTKVKNKVDFLARNYKDKFTEFMNETQNQKILTRLGTQKVVLNTIETSNTILRRLVNYLVADMEKKAGLRDSVGIANVLDKEVSDEVKSEYAHACARLGVCRSTNDFMDFLHDFFTEILMNDDTKLKMAIDALTEVFKYEDFSNVIDKKLNYDFRKTLELLEKRDPVILRVVMTALNQMVAARNKPLVVNGAGSDVVSQSVALMDVFDTVNQKLPPTEENKLVWSDIMKSLKEWREGKRNDILEIMQALSSHIKNKGINKFDTVTADAVNAKLRILLREQD